MDTNREHPRKSAPLAEPLKTKQPHSQDLGNAAALCFNAGAGIWSLQLTKRLRTQIWASDALSTVWSVSAVSVFAREWACKPSEPVGEVCSEPRKRSALGQAKGAQAKPELNVAKPHLFGSVATKDLVLVLYGVWGEVLPKVFFSDFLSACSPPLLYLFYKPLLKPLLEWCFTLLSVTFHKCLEHKLSVYQLHFVCLSTTLCLFINYTLSVYQLHLFSFCILYNVV